MRKLHGDKWIPAFAGMTVVKLGAQARSSSIILTCAISLFLIAASTGWSAEPEMLGKVQFSGAIDGPEDISAVTLIHGFLVIGSDSSNKVQILRPAGEGYEVFRDVVLDPSTKEIDIEGVASEGETVYVMGSHSRNRKQVDPKKDYSENRTRIQEIKRLESREQLFRFKLDPQGNVSELKATTLTPVTEQDKLLSEFARLSCRENGVDIEGIAVRDTRLYAGFRAPVLRDQSVPVLAFRFGEGVTEPDLLFVNLGGLGIRDITAVKDGFLIIGGPVTDGSGEYRLYFWDGKDCLPGERPGGEKPGRTELLGTIPTEGKAKAEGITVLKEDGLDWEVLVVFDGPSGGGATRLRVRKP